MSDTYGSPAPTRPRWMDAPVIEEDSTQPKWMQAPLINDRRVFEIQRDGKTYQVESANPDTASASLDEHLGASPSMGENTFGKGTMANVADTLSDANQPTNYWRAVRQLQSSKN